MRPPVRLLASLAVAAAFATAAPAFADVTIGVSLPLTGPTSALGIPSKNGILLWPATVAGEKLNVIILDDATDPTQGVKNARRFVTEDHVDLILGSAATPIAVAMAPIAAEGQTVQLTLSPIPTLPDGKDAWSFRLPQSTAVMAIPIVDYWKKTGVKTFGFLGYTDSYGEAWLADISAQAEKAGIKRIDVERFARPDTSVTGQALKLVQANPDAILIAASGSGAAMPHKGLVERGYPRSKIFQTHGAASLDLIRVGGKDVEGSFVSSGPATVADLLPDSNPSKAIGMKYLTDYDKGLRPEDRQPVRRARLRRLPRAAAHRSRGAEEGQAGHGRVPRGAEDGARDHRPPAGLARRPQLHRDRPLRLHARHRRAADDRQRRLEAGADALTSPTCSISTLPPRASCCSTAPPTAPSTRCWRSRSS